jgi:hypothetical protein
MSRPKKQRIGPWAALRVWSLGLLLCLAACITPTLPPDDPPAPEVELGVGVARLRGHVGVGPAFVLVLNRVNGLVFGQQTPTGAYDFEVISEPCDALALWYTMGSFQSSAITFRPAEIVGRRGECSEAMPPDDTDAGP